MRNRNSYFTDRPVRDYRSALAHDKAKLQRFNHLMLENGVLKAEHKSYIGPCRSDADIDKTDDAIRASVAGLRRQGTRKALSKRPVRSWMR